MSWIIRGASLADVGAILEIYAPYVTGTCISFETEAPPIEDFSERVENTLRCYPYLVCEVDGAIRGYAYASRHRERAAYKYSADVSVYIAPEYHRRGIGRALYADLFELLRKKGIFTVFAGITLPNDKSVGLHKSLGFSEAGVFHNDGFKFGRWLDVMWMEKPLRDYTANPESR